MVTKEEAKKEIQKLVQKYEKALEEDRINKYNEEETKKDFILPLFRALGWDVEDSLEVRAEEKISKKRVDYSFRIHGITKFFLEAKQLSDDIFNPKYITQAINYSYWQTVTWAVLTNFKNLVVFNAEWKGRNLSENRFVTLSCREFINKFDELWLLSRESFEKNLIDEKAVSLGKKQKREPIGDKILADMINWRNMLTKNINKYDHKLDEETLDEAVQRILDRLIFIKSCEDRGIESPILLTKARQWAENWQHAKGLWEELKHVFRDFDNKYNSKLFEHHICESLKIDNDVINKIIIELNSDELGLVKYDFSAIPADVLGNIYEQYLGHILKKSQKTTKIIEKHAHRKEQGIYYTPTYIVDYIVRNTIIECVRDKNLDQVLELKILDPACGSGSFLIRAYTMLLDVVENKLKKNDFSKKFIAFRNYSGRLNISQKITILTSCIFGVDLDTKAVEIAQLNLLMKLLEGETSETLSNIKEMKKLLPMLTNNIKCGNSLIDDPKLAVDSAFIWEKEFAEIMKEGGFDIIIGNPPYGIIFKENEKHYLEEHLPSFKRNNDLYVAFIEKSLSLLKEGGEFSFIVPNTYLIGSYFDSLKRLILNRAKIIKILDFGINHVFQDPNVFNSIMVLQKESNQSKREKNISEFYDVSLLKNSDFFNLEGVSLKTEIIQSQLSDLIWKPKNKIIEKIFLQKDNILDEICYVKDVGFNYWSIGRGKKRGDSIGSRILYDGVRKNQKDIPYLKGRDIIRYNYIFGNHWLKHDYEKHLNKKTDIFRFSPEFLEFSPKIIYRQTADRIIATIDFDKYYLDKTVHLIIPRENVKINILSLLGILNSRLMLYLYRDMVREEGRTFAQVKTVYIKKIPLRFNEKLEAKISELVRKQLNLNKRLNEIGDKKTDERSKIEEEIKKTDNEIDELIYRIYDITEAEKKVIEESLKCRKLSKNSKL